MSSAVVPTVPSDDARSRAAASEASLFRLYTLRVCYLILALGLGAYIWPVVISHTNDVAIAAGVRLALLAGLGATAALGIRYPLHNVAVTAIRAGLEGHISDRVCDAAMVRTQDQHSGIGRHKSRPDGCDFPAAHSMALCVRAFRHLARRPLEVELFAGPGRNSSLIGRQRESRFLHAQ